MDLRLNQTDAIFRHAPVPRQVPPGHHQAGMAPGVNIEPGCADDGWIVPPRLTLTDGTAVQLYKDGEALHAAYDAIDSAQHRICLEVYIFRSDPTGRAFAELLCKKARAGIPVYLIYDSLGCLDSDPVMFEQMASAGIRMGVFHPIKPWDCTYSWRPFNRDHRKLLIIDDHTAGLGGLNIGGEYAGSWILRRRKLFHNPYHATPRRADTPEPLFDKTHLTPGATGSLLPVPSSEQSTNGSPPHGLPPRELDNTLTPWRDNAVGLRGPAARLLLIPFTRMWRYTQHGGKLHNTEFLYNTDQGEFGVLASSPTRRSPLLFLRNMLRNARSSILLTMSYFAPPDELIDELCRAARRGVRVRLMLPNLSDVKLLLIAARSFYETLLTAGVEIYERLGAVLHAKTMCIDAHTTILGSTNLDYRSIEYNCELSVILRNPAFAAQIHDLFENDVRFARRILLKDWRRRPTWDRFVQWAVWRARYLL